MSPWVLGGSLVAIGGCLVAVAFGPDVRWRLRRRRYGGWIR